MDHDVSLAGSAVGPATLVVAESVVRVHWRILLLALGTNKSAVGPACSSTPWLNHGSLGYYQRDRTICLEIVELGKIKSPDAIKCIWNS